MRTAIAASLSAALLLAAAPALAQEKAQADNGTDPTRVSRTLIIDDSYTDLRNGLSTNQIEFYYTQPLASHTGLIFYVPFNSVGGTDNGDTGLGDASLKLTQVFGISKAGGNVLQAELSFDTADRPELGAGQNVLNLTYIRAFFLSNRAIFAPSFKESYGLDGGGESRVNTLTVDFYYVPKLKNPRALMTVDPAWNFDWQTGKTYPALAVTYGYVVGKAYGGNSILYIKPSAAALDDRAFDWGLEAGFKLIGF